MKIPCRLVAILYFLTCSIAIKSEVYYCDFNQEIRSVYGLILKLELNQAKILLDKRQGNNSNLAFIFLENTLDFYKYFILEENSDKELNKDHKESRIKIINKSDLPIQWKRFLNAEFLLHWAMIHIKQGDLLLGFQNFYSAVKLLELNVKEFPDFIYSYKSLGILHSLMSGIPDSYKWAAEFIGLKGQMNTGKKELQNFINYAEKTNDLFLEESYGAMSFLTAYLENKPDKAYFFWVKKMGFKDPNPLFAYVQCRLAIRANYNDAAINILQSLPKEEQNKFPYLHFLLGLVKLQKLDPKAEFSFKQFLKLYPGSSHIKETYQKLAWNSLLQGKNALYHLYISKCLFEGNNINDEDKQAYFEAKNSNTPDSILLRSRLLCDGAYIDQAMETLQSVSEAYFEHPNKKLEYMYRLARIYQLRKDYNIASSYFKEVVIKDSSALSYMSCNALLQLGNINEILNKREEAKEYFKLALAREPELYKQSIHQKAKAGLSRLN